MTEDVERLLALVAMLDAERFSLIADAWDAYGRPHAIHAMTAAKRAGRMVEVCEAMKEMSMSVSLVAILNDWSRADTEKVVWAARNAGVAAATEDLLGTVAYSTREYNTLMNPWIAGFRDVPLREKETAHE